MESSSTLRMIHWPAPNIHKLSLWVVSLLWLSLYNRTEGSWGEEDGNFLIPWHQTYLDRYGRPGEDVTSCVWPTLTGTELKLVLLKVGIKTSQSSSNPFLMMPMFVLLFWCHFLEDDIIRKCLLSVLQKTGWEWYWGHRKYSLLLTNSFPVTVKQYCQENVFDWEKINLEYFYNLNVKTLQ